MYLDKIGGVIEQLCGGITGITGFGVIIADRELNKLCKTTADEEENASRNSIIAQVMQNGRPVVMDQRKGHYSCSVCKAKSTCRVEGFIGVPVFYGGQVVGCIALIAPVGQSIRYFNSIRSVVAFLERMAALLTEALACCDAASRPACALQNGFITDDLADVGYAVTGKDGEILSYNKAFFRFFPLPGGETYPDILELLFPAAHKKAKRLSRFYYSAQEQDGFYGSVTVLPCDTYGPGEGEGASLYVFRSLRCPADSFENNAYGRLLEPFSRKFSPYMMAFDRALSLAGNRMPVFLCGRVRDGRDLLANYIHSHSQRHNDYFVSIDCSEIAMYDQLETVLGIPGDISGNGLLWKANKGTVHFKNLEYMSTALQKALSRLFSGQLSCETYGIYGRLDIRFLFSSGEPAQDLHARGFLCDELYQVVADNVVAVPRLQPDDPSFLPLLDSLVEAYARRSGVSGVRLSSELKDAIRRRPGLGALDLQRYAQLIVDAVPPHTIALSDVPSLRPLLADGPEGDGLAELKRLVDSGMKKTLIAEKLGVSRATLYRKLKKLGPG